MKQGCEAVEILDDSVPDSGSGSDEVKPGPVETLSLIDPKQVFTLNI